MTFYFDYPCPSAKEYLSLSLSSAAAHFSDAAKSSIPFDGIKRHPKAWWSAEVEDAVSENVRQGPLIRLDRSSEYWGLPLNPNKYKAFFFSVDPY